jgi:hypothetical protein
MANISLVADMQADGVFVIDGETFKQTGFIPTGRGAHGLYPSRDGKKIYVTKSGHAHGRNEIAWTRKCLRHRLRNIAGREDLADSGRRQSPDMGNVSADGNTLWLSGRFDKACLRYRYRNRRRPHYSGCRRNRTV